MDWVKYFFQHALLNNNGRNKLSKVPSSQILPLIVAVIISVYVYLYKNSLIGWDSFAITFCQILLELSPIFVCKYFSTQVKGKLAIMWWGIGFIALPLSGYILVSNNPDMTQWLLSDETTFVSLYLIELLSLVNNWLNKGDLSFKSIRLTLDNIMLVMVVLFSFIVALVLNSHVDPVNNQPFLFTFDLPRNTNNLGGLLSYWLQMLVVYGSLYLVYLVNHQILVKRVLSQKGIFAYLWLTTLFLLICAPILAQIVLWLPMNDSLSPVNASGNRNPFDFWNLYISSVVVAFSTPVVMAFKLQKDHRDMAELQQEKLHTELKWLQQQINPHFLFNTLNNLYSLCLSKSERAPEAILQLANLLRFVVYKGSDDLVKLSEEIDYLSDYLALQQLRVANKCQFDVELTKDNIQGLHVSPLLMVNFLENAIKHGVEPSDKSTWLKVSLVIQNATLTFVCENSKPEHKAREKNNIGIGLKNVKRRLQLMYPNRHSLRQTENETSYKITLVLSLQPSKNASSDSLFDNSIYLNKRMVHGKQTEE